MNKSTQVSPPARPEIGGPATVYFDDGDRHGATVTGLDGDVVVVQLDRAIFPGGARLDAETLEHERAPGPEFAFLWTGEGWAAVVPRSGGWSVIPNPRWWVVIGDRSTRFTSGGSW